MAIDSINQIESSLDVDDNINFNAEGGEFE